MTYQQKQFYKKSEYYHLIREGGEHFEIDLHSLNLSKNSGILANLTAHMVLYLSLSSF